MSTNLFARPFKPAGWRCPRSGETWPRWKRKSAASSNEPLRISAKMPRYLSARDKGRLFALRELTAPLQLVSHFLVDSTGPDEVNTRPQMVLFSSRQTSSRPAFGRAAVVAPLGRFGSLPFMELTHGPQSNLQQPWS